MSQQLRPRPQAELPSAEVVVRAMRKRDVRQVAAIERRSYSVPWSLLTFRSLLKRPNAVMLVAESGRKVVGYAALWVSAGEAELGNLAVTPERRGQGIARRLLDRVLQAAWHRGASIVLLEVRASNHVARGLYRSAGFDLISIRAGYYSAPQEDALVMRRSLTEAPDPEHRASDRP